MFSLATSPEGGDAKASDDLDLDTKDQRYVHTHPQAHQWEPA